MPDLDEFGRIARFFAPLAAGAPGAFGLTDDAAAIDDSLVVTSDALVEGVHFVGDEPPGLIARKALRVNLSDLAAMAARPVGYVLALVLPRRFDDDWLAGFAAGLAADQAEFGLSLLGGDTVATPGPLTLAITAFGRKVGGLLRRSGSQAGDRIYVSGTIGDAALGLDALQGRLHAGTEDAAWLIDRYRLPRPRLGLGMALGGLAHAGMDISDGLVGDLGHLAAASGLAAEIDAAALPLSPAAARAIAADPRLLGRVLGGGDDYELLFTVSPANHDTVLRLAAETRVPVTAVGTMRAGRGVTVRAADGGDITPDERSYRHF